MTATKTKLVVSNPDTITYTSPEKLLGVPPQRVKVSYTDTGAFLDDVLSRDYVDGDKVRGLGADHILRKVVIETNVAMRTDQKARWSKVFSKALWTNGNHRLDPQTISVMANIAKEHEVNVSEVVDICRDVDWSDGNFGKRDSCWWHDNSLSYWADINNGYCLRFWSEDMEGKRPIRTMYHKGIGRAWLWEEPNNGGVLMFNLYYDDANVTDASRPPKPTLRTMQAAYLLRSLLGLKTIKRVTIDSDTWYINDSSGILVSPQDPAPKNGAYIIEPPFPRPPRDNDFHDDDDDDDDDDYSAPYYAGDPLVHLSTRDARASVLLIIDGHERAGDISRDSAVTFRLRANELVDPATMERYREYQWVALCDTMDDTRARIADLNYANATSREVCEMLLLYLELRIMAEVREEMRPSLTRPDMLRFAGSPFFANLPFTSTPTGPTDPADGG